MTGTQSLKRNKMEVENLGELFSNNGVYLFDYRGLNVAEFEDLRSRVKKIGANVKVIKNRIAIKYFEEKKEKHGRELFNGPTAVAYADENFIEVAKILVDFEKESKKIKIKPGFIEDVFVDINKVREVAKLPSKEQLMAQIAFSVAMPLKKFGMSLSAPLKNFIVLLNNLKDKKGKEENNG
jgi:large subunit ribosomal protein L10